MKLKKVITSLFIILSIGFTSCNTGTKPNRIEVLVNGNSGDEFNITVGDTFSLSVDSSLPINYSVDDSSIVSLNENGVGTALKLGTAIISASYKKYSSIKTSLFINVKAKVEQIGVGSGFSADDPIFIGNEGEDEPLEVYFIEMRQMYADSIYIKKGNVDILIDAGETLDGELVNQILKEKMNDNRLDLLMASHGDSDHIAGMPNALKGIENVSLVIDYGGSATNVYTQVRDEYIKKGTTYHSAYDCANFTAGITSRYYFTSDFYLDILDTGQYIANDYAKAASNPQSVSCLFTYKDFTFFTSGDITTSTEESLVNRTFLPNVTLYKASHHGSNGSNSRTILDALNPKGVAISSARPSGSYGDDNIKPSQNNTYNLDGGKGHPYDEAMQRIYQTVNIMKDLRVYWNMVNGTMCFTTYGENDFAFHGSPTLKGYYDLSKTNGEAVWNEELQDFENKVTGEEDKKLSDTIVFKTRGYDKFLATAQ